MGTQPNLTWPKLSQPIGTQPGPSLTYRNAACYVFTIFLSFFTAKSQAPVQHASYKNSPTPTHVPLLRFSPSLSLILSYRDHTVQRQSNKLALELSKEHRQEAGLAPPVPPPGRHPPPRSHPPPVRIRSHGSNTIRNSESSEVLFISLFIQFPETPVTRSHSGKHSNGTIYPICLT